MERIVYKTSDDNFLSATSADGIAEIVAKIQHTEGRSDWREADLNVMIQADGKKKWRIVVTLQGKDIKSWTFGKRAVNKIQEILEDYK